MQKNFFGCVTVTLKLGLMLNTEYVQVFKSEKNIWQIILDWTDMVAASSYLCLSLITDYWNMANEATESFGILVEALANLQDANNGSIGITLPKVISTFQEYVIGLFRIRWSLSETRAQGKALWSRWWLGSSSFLEEKE